MLPLVELSLFAKGSQWKEWNDPLFLRLQTERVLPYLQLDQVLLYDLTWHLRVLITLQVELPQIQVLGCLNKPLFQVRAALARSAQDLSLTEFLSSLEEVPLFDLLELFMCHGDMSSRTLMRLERHLPVI